MPEQAIQRALHLGTGHAAQCGHYGGQTAGQAHGLPKITYLSAGLHIGQGGGFGGQGDGVGKFAIERVVGQINVGQLGGLAQRAETAVGAGVAAQIGDDIAIVEQGGVCGFGDVDGRDVVGGECGEFVCLADAVLIEVAPESEIGEAGVTGINLAVGVGVFLRERGKTIDGIAAAT